MRVVATAGHVDHGKSSLVLALTGTDPDRWPEEKTRGLTIDLGFAFTTLPSGQELGFVDVPGHVRFLKNMLAGVGAVEAAILVVAATEGWMPQSEEHLRILDLLGISHGLAVITKADLVDDDLLELARLEVEERLAGAASFTPTEVLAVDSRSGRGLPELRVALDAMLASAPLAADRGRPEAVGRPGLRRQGRRHRRDRHHGRRHPAARRRGPAPPRPQAGPGPPHREPPRGTGRGRPGPAGGPQPGRHRPHRAGPRLGPRPPRPVGGHVSGRRRPDRPARRRAPPGHLQGLHRLRRARRPPPPDPPRTESCRRPGALRAAPARRAPSAPARGPHRAPGLRQPGHRRRSRGARRLARRAGPAGGRPAAAADRAADPGRAALAAAGRDRAAGRRRAGRGEAPRRGARALRRRPSGRGAPRGGRDPGRPPAAGARARGRLPPAPAARARASTCRPWPPPSGSTPPGPGPPSRAPRASWSSRAGPGSHPTGAGSPGEPEAQRLLAALDAVPFSPPAPAEVGGSPEIVRGLLREGLLVDLDGTIFTAAAVEKARQVVREGFERHGSLTVSQARDLLGSSRKYVLAILAHFDAEGVTRRRGDERFPGPRLGS